MDGNDPALSPSITDEDMQYISFWVQVRGIPIQYLSQRMVIRIGHEMGQFLETDFQTDGAQNVDYVRICLLWNVTTPLCFQRIFRFGGQSLVLKFRYEKLCGFCNTCGLMIHYSSECPLNNDNDLDDQPPGDNNGGDDDGNGSDDDANDHSSGLSPRDAPPQAEEDKNEEHHVESPDYQNKKCKTEYAQIPSITFHTCAEVRQAYFTEDFEEVSVKRMKKVAEAQEARCWNSWKQDDGAGYSGVQYEDAQYQPNNSEGKVGPKPPEPG